MTAFKSSLKFALLSLALIAGAAQPVFAQTPPVLAITPGNLLFNYSVGGTPPVSQAVTIAPSNTTTTSATITSASITYTGSATGWLLIPQTNLATPASLNVFVTNLGALTPGTYAATVTLTYTGADPSSTSTFGIFLNVTAAGGGGGGFNETVTASPTSLAFSAPAGGATPVAQTVTVMVNDGAAFTASAVTNDGNPWLIASVPTGGGVVNVSVNPSILNSGNYAGTVNIKAPNAIAQVSVTLAVGALTLSTNPSSLTFTIPQNYGYGAAQSIQVTSATPAAITASATSDNNWLVVDTTNATTPAAIIVRANDSSLPQGTYMGMINIQTSPTNMYSVPVTLIVGPPAIFNLSPANLTFSYTIGNPVPPMQTTNVKSLNGSVQNFTVASTTNDGAAWLMGSAVSPTPGQVQVSVSPTTLSPGSYTGVVTVTPATTGASPQPIAVSLTVLPAPTPVVSAVVSSASYAVGVVAPGEFVTLFGSTLGPATGVTPPTGTFPQTLGGTMVMFDGIPAPILYASSTQISVQVPYGISIGQTMLTVQRTGVTTKPMPITSVPAFPGLFTSNQSGKGQLAALNADFSLNSPSNPAMRGSFIILYGTGEGVTTPTSIEGVLTPTVAPLPQTALPVMVSFQGAIGTVKYAGETPGVVSGLLQINAVIPQNAPTGAAVSVLVTINGQTSPGGATIAIQ